MFLQRDARIAMKDIGKFTAPSSECLYCHIQALWDALRNGSKTLGVVGKESTSAVTTTSSSWMSGCSCAYILCICDSVTQFRPGFGRTTRTATSGPASPDLSLRATSGSRPSSRSVTTDTTTLAPATSCHSRTAVIAASSYGKSALAPSSPTLLRYSRFPSAQSESETHTADVASPPTPALVPTLALGASREKLRRYCSASARSSFWKEKDGFSSSVPPVLASLLGAVRSGLSPTTLAAAHSLKLSAVIGRNSVVGASATSSTRPTYAKERKVRILNNADDRRSTLPPCRFAVKACIVAISSMLRRPTTSILLYDVYLCYVL
mmetsp:Transcript_43/g.60  ORF Transcript_43/g.60 Transcript_43/m.60 type:complete len:322 (+) Transcript_43:388-1353(+)